MFTTVFNADLLFKSVLLQHFIYNYIVLLQMYRCYLSYFIDLGHTIFINYVGGVNIVFLYYDVHCCLCWMITRRMENEGKF